MRITPALLLFIAAIYLFPPLVVGLLALGGALGLWIYDATSPRAKLRRELRRLRRSVERVAGEDVRAGEPVQFDTTGKVVPFRRRRRFG